MGVEEENVNSSASERKKEEEIPGLDFFPERRGDSIQRNFFRKYIIGENKDNLQRIKCERRVHEMIEKSPILKHMLGALKSTGCGFDLNRHVSCEPCSKIVTGGYDPELNQIVVCQNMATNNGMVQGVLAHEMLHMFDYCRAHLDFKNIEHLACTEIRAANLMHCSFLSAMLMGAASPMRIKEQHKACVRQKALASVMAVRDVTLEEATAAVDRVFTRCYNDLEPLGRRLRRNSNDQERIYRERYHYGYGY